MPLRAWPCKSPVRDLGPRSRQVAALPRAPAIACPPCRLSDPSIMQRPRSSRSTPGYRQPDCGRPPPTSTCVAGRRVPHGCTVARTQIYTRNNGNGKQRQKPASDPTKAHAGRLWGAGQLGKGPPVSRKHVWRDPANVHITYGT